MIDRLAEPIILQILREVPQLALVNRKLYLLAELGARTRLLTYFDFENSEVEELVEDIRNHTQFQSWRTAEGVAKSDYWIFSPEHVSDKKQGVYTLPGEPYGLQLTTWVNKSLQYVTQLRCGTYMLYLDALMDPYVMSQVTIDVVNSPHVHCNFSRSPPKRWLDTQLTRMSLSMDQQRNDFDMTRYNGIESMRWRIGTITVNPEKSSTSEWANFTIQLKIYGWDSSLSGVVLNYLKFEPLRSTYDGPTEWVLTTPFDRPTFGMAQVYRRASERKRRRSMKALTAV